jgi:hypothetical protein
MCSICTQLCASAHRVTVYDHFDRFDLSTGKTTLAKAVVSRINELAGAELAAQLPMDGFHFYRKELDAMPDPKVDLLAGRLC